MRVKIHCGTPRDWTAAPKPKPPQDDVSERALSHPEVRRFQEMFPDAQVRVVRNLKAIRQDTMKLPGNMQAMMKQAEQMQKKMQEEIALIRVEASAGGGMVTVNMDGKKNVTAVKIDPEVAGDVEMLQDMVMAAFNEAAKKVDEATQEKMGGHAGRHGLPPGMLF